MLVRTSQKLKQLVKGIIADVEQIWYAIIKALFSAYLIAIISKILSFPVETPPHYGQAYQLAWTGN